MPAFLPSELPLLASTRHHWIVLLRPPHKWWLIFTALVIVFAIVEPVAGIPIFVIFVGVAVYLRVASWRAERIYLTQSRIVRVQGIPETTTSEASLRLDRISGARVIQTVPGKLFNYSTILLEAPGEHPEVRRLLYIADPTRFYLILRRKIFGDGHADLDPDDVPQDHITERLPVIRPARISFRKR